MISRCFSDNLKSSEELNYVLYAFVEYGTKEFSVSQIRSAAETAMGDKEFGLKVNKVKEYLEDLADESENRNILVKTNIEAYKVKSYKTAACLEMVLYVEDDLVHCTKIDDFDEQ